MYKCKSFVFQYLFYEKHNPRGRWCDDLLGPGCFMWKNSIQYQGFFSIWSNCTVLILGGFPVHHQEHQLEMELANFWVVLIERACPWVCCVSFQTERNTGMGYGILGTWRIKNKNKARQDCSFGENIWDLFHVWAKGAVSLSFSDFFSIWLSYSSDSLHPWQQGRVLQQREGWGVFSAAHSLQLSHHWWVSRETGIGGLAQGTGASFPDSFQYLMFLFQVSFQCQPQNWKQSIFLLFI